MEPPGGAHAGDATARFTELVQRADHSIPLDEAMLCIAAHDHPVDERSVFDELDALSAAAPDDPDALAHELFVTQGFRGNTGDYGDPRNSFLDEVLARRVGIPITLSILMIEVGRRRGLDLGGVGMPGHFLVGGAPGVYYDPFHGGARLDVDGARRLFATVQGDMPFRRDYLARVGPRAICARVLANLVNTYVDRDPPSAIWATRLRLRIPGLSAAERRSAATLLGSLGQFDEAARELESLVSLADDDGARRLARDAAALRARAN